MQNNIFDLDKPLLEFLDKADHSYWTIRDAVQGVQVFGGIGSGKTSGSGRTLAYKYLVHGFGGLVLTVKPDEKELWQEYCRLTNRQNDLIIVEPGGQYYFNFLEYESAGGSITENIVQVLKTVIRAGEEKSSGKNDDPFWENASDILIYNTIDLCRIAYGSVSVQQLYNIIITAPRQEQKSDPSSKIEGFIHAFEAANKNVNAQIESFEKNLSDTERQQLEDSAAFENAILQAIPDAALLKHIDQFFIEQYRNLSEKTRSIIDFSFSGFLFRLLKEPVYSLFCRQSNFSPDDCLNGKIILINLPVKLYHKVGRDAQIIFKYVFQRAMEKRDVSKNGRPVFLWADEAQHFLHEYDTDYQATARSSRIITTYLSQNLPNYYANMGSIKYEYKVKAFLGTLATKIFHANADIETNTYASDLIGEGYARDASHTATTSGQFSVSETGSFRLEKMVRPEHFISLKCGGPNDQHIAECYIHKQGSGFADGRNFKKIKFRQS